MNRYLLLLNLALAVLAATAGWHLRREWRAARARERAVLGQRVKPLPPPPMSRLPEAAPVKPASYADIAQKMLFAKDRNPAVIVETAPPPPPKPMPPLPILHGLMNLGDGLSAIMSEDSKAPHKEFHPGERIGPFKLVAVRSDSVTLDWDGKQVTKTLQELADHGEKEQQQKQADAAAQQRAAAPPAPPPPSPSEAARPGDDIGQGEKACRQGDTSPAGTIADGMRKVLVTTPFGPHCSWQPVK